MNKVPSHFSFPVAAMVSLVDLPPPTDLLPVLDAATTQLMAAGKLRGSRRPDEGKGAEEVLQPDEGKGPISLMFPTIDQIFTTSDTLSLPHGPAHAW
uniref:Uncharacterized protein n=1 Tax=Aegilops tauschii subsp. strangulata TaxID=200361 RepID=A0A453BMQ2_AEGTS